MPLALFITHARTHRLAFLQHRAEYRKSKLLLTLTQTALSMCQLEIAEPERNNRVSTRILFPRNISHN